MSLCMELSDTALCMLGACALLMMTGALYLLISVTAKHMGWSIVLPAAALAAASVLVVQSLGDLALLRQHDRTYNSLAGVIGRLPWAYTALLLFLLAAAEILLLLLLHRKSEKMLTPEAIKESLDALPDGICFSDGEGMPLLLNIRMNRLSAELLDSGIMNADTFWNELQEGELKNGAERISVRPTTVIRTGGGEVWDFRRREIKAGGESVQELAAYNVTEHYRLNWELDRQNESLNQMNERLRQYSRDVERVAAEKELLRARMRVHDDVGRALLAFRAYLAQPEAERDREGLLSLWRDTVSMLRNEAAPAAYGSDWELLQKAAEAVDVTIVTEGVLPENGTERTLIIAALRECLTNTVKHARGNRLYLSVSTEEALVKARLTNNGIRPSHEIQESGGLKNLRHTVEAANGVMRVESVPRFALYIELPKGDEEKWQGQE